MSARPPVGSVLGAVERAAWRVPLSSRRFFLALAFIVAAAVIGSSSVAAVVSARNAHYAADARDRSLRVASSLTDFRAHLSAADAEAATTQVFGDAESPLGRSRYEADLLDAGLALTQAGLVATGANADDIAVLADGLVRYADLMDTSRSYPVGSTFVEVSRDIARGDLAPGAERVRSAAEQDMTAAARRASGPAVPIAISALAVGLAVLVTSAILVAGRTRRLMHPLLVAAVAVFTTVVVVVTAGLWAQRRELRAAADNEIDAYITANTTAFTLFDLRLDEMDAVASRGNGASLYAQFRRDAEWLVGRLDNDSVETGGSLVPAVLAYMDGVGEVETADAAGDNRTATDAMLHGDSAIPYREARGIATNTVSRAATEVAERLEAAADADVEPLLPVGLGSVAAGLAAAGILSRGWRYR